jgi:hypothetical protein
MHVQDTASCQIKVESTGGTASFKATQGGVDKIVLRGDTGASYIDAGNVGIGTNTPINTLHIIGPSSDGSSSADNALSVGTSTNGMIIGANDAGNYAFIQTRSADDLSINPFGGDVGIGTNTPEVALHVVDPTGPYALILDTDSTFCGQIYRNNGRTLGAVVTASQNDNWLVRTNNSDSFTVNGTGELIGNKLTNTLIDNSSDGKTLVTKDWVKKVPKTKSATILSVTTSDDATLFYTPTAITVSGVHSVVTGGGNFVTFNIQHASSRNGTPNNVLSSSELCNVESGKNTTTGFDDNDIPAGSWVWVNVITASAVDFDFHVTVEYTED